MYIATVPNRNSPPAILLREGWREGNKTRQRTLANLSHWPQEKIETFRRLLHDEPLVSPQDLLSTQKTLPHGHVEALLLALRKLGLDSMISAQRCRERDLVLAMIVERLLDPCSKLATTRQWHSTTLAEELGVGEATEDELYAAMDWLRERQERIEKKLAARHLREGSLVLYDVSSSYYEGRHCPLAQYGHDRDGQKGLPIIVYGLLTDPEGRPLAVQVYPGNTGDPTTVVDQVNKLRERFQLSRVVLVGDRGMLTRPQIDKLKAHPEMGWITALTSVAIRGLLAEGSLQLSLLDEKNLVEIQSPEYPGERLMVCYNPLLAEERKGKREELLTATEKALARIGKASGTTHEEADDDDRDCFEGGQGAGTLQDGQTLRAPDRGGEVQLGAAGGGDRAGSEVGWDLCDSHQCDGGAIIGGRCGARVQKSGAGRARLPQFERPGSVDSSHSSSHRGASAGAYLPMHVGLLRGVAPAACVGLAAV